MVRPRNGRWIGCKPLATLYKPAGVPATVLEIISVDLDELEAMRLVDGEDMQQSDAAAEMKISRSTVGRLLESGRKKIVKALINGHGLDIQEGDAPINYHALPRFRRQRRGRNAGQMGEQEEQNTEKGGDKDAR